MALQTDGFGLSALPRAPNVPKNIGLVDVKGIYDGVRQGLAAFETVRQAPASMALADATMAAKTAEAPLGTQILSEQAAQGPLRTAAMEFENSPEMRAAKVGALSAKGTAKPLTGDAYKLQRAAELRRAMIEHPDDQIIAAEYADVDNQLKKSQMIASERNAAMLAANAARVKQSGVNNANTVGTQRDIAVGNNATSLATNAATNASRESEGEKNRVAQAARDASAQAAHKEINDSQLAFKAAAVNAKTDASRAMVSSKARNALALGEKRNEIFNETVAKVTDALSGSPGGEVTDSSIPGGNIASAMSRVIGAFIPGSPSANLDSLIDTLKSDAGLKELEMMRLAAPGSTGASGLGQVTEKELVALQNRLANLKFSQSDKQLYDNIKTFQDMVNTAWKNARAAYEFDYGPNGAAYQNRLVVPGAMNPAAAPSAPVAPPKFKIVEVK